ncbi:MAG: hypothetical protein ABIQ12_07140 [Opitutaceae bacterium]
MKIPHFTKLALLVPTALLAQVVTPPAATPTEKEIVVLSPFTVTDTEQGWVATQSLAGSRLKTDVKDIAAPLEILTKDFMEEFAVNSIYDASIYTTNVEGAGDNYERDISFDNGTGFPPLARIRGLGDATLSRDFFGTKMTTDNYNLDRITIASGPNNLLFGTGSPAGVIDSSLKRAAFRNRTSYQLQFDSNDSQRTAIDINRVLIKDRLALRFDFLKDHKEYAIKPSGTDNTRFYGTVRWAPTKKTSISVHYEDAKVRNISPQLVLPYDQVSLWYKAASSGFTGPGMNVNQPAYTNPAAGAAFVASSITNTIWARDTSSPVYFAGSAGGLQGKSYNVFNTVNIKSPTTAPTVDPLNNEADGYTLLDGTYYPVKKNIGGLERLEDVRSRISNFFITHQFTDNLSIELAAQQERYDGWVDGAANYTSMATLRVDSNRFAPDGVTLNPNFGKRFTESFFRSAHDMTKTRDWRVALSYEKNFAKEGNTLFHRLAGKQRLGALMSANDFEYKWGFYDYYISPKQGVDPVFPGITLRAPTFDGWATNASRQLKFRYYIDGDDLAPRWPGLGSHGAPIMINDANGNPFTMDPQHSGYTDKFGRRLGTNLLVFLQKNHQETKQLAYQGFFWGDRISATLGWRKDTANTANPANSPFIRDPATGYFPIVEDVTFDSFDSANEQSGSTRTLGLVLRPLRGLVKLPLGAELDLVYNKSDTFQPSVSSRNPLGDHVNGTAGKGVDKGFRLGLFDGKFNFRFTKFETSGGPARAANVPYNRWRANASRSFLRMMGLFSPTGNAQTPLDAAFPEMFPVLGASDPYWVTSDKKSTGTEYGLDWNVTPNFQLRFNMNRQEVVETNVGTVWWAFLDKYLPQLQALTFREGGNSNPRDLNGNGRIDTWDWKTAWITDTDPTTVEQNWNSTAVGGSTGSDFIKSLEGRPNDFVRADRYNLNAVYRFNEGRLKGFSIGGAFRHRAAPVVGYGKKIVNGAGVFDLNNRLKGSVENYLDLSFNYRGKADYFFFKTYRVGLNIRNVLDRDDLFPRLINVSGVATRVSRPSEPRVFILSMTGEF